MGLGVFMGCVGLGQSLPQVWPSSGLVSAHGPETQAQAQFIYKIYTLSSMMGQDGPLSKLG